MLCDKCNQREANVHITKIINNEKTSLNLCEECAREYQEQMGFMAPNFSFPSFSFHKFLASLLESPTMMPEKTGIPLEGLQCPVCGTTRQVFSQYGKLGCDRCYDTFAVGLSPLIKRVHGRERHTGKVPGRGGQAIKLKKELETLKRRLQELVAREEFEEAAKVRDQIRELEHGKG